MKKTILIILSVAILLVVISSFTSKSKTDSELFDIANQKLVEYKIKKRNYVILIDYTKPITSERLYVLNMKTNEVVIKSTVSHSFKSGMLYPSDYSNISGSNKSSKGGFISKGTYMGGFGFSMVIRGLDKGINNNAESRKIIFHPTKKMLTPWSYGCFATPDDVNQKLIDLTKNGSFIYVISE